MIYLFCKTTRKGCSRYYFYEKKLPLLMAKMLCLFSAPHNRVVVPSMVIPVSKDTVIVSAEDENTRYVTSSPMIREVFRKGKKGWYYAGWYKV